jgi:hypothetical protein
LLLLTANIATLGYLWMHKNRPGNGNMLPPQPPPQGQVFEFVTKELQLDSVQQQAYKLLREDHQMGQRPLQDSIRKAKDNFFALLQQPAAPDSLIQIQSSKVAAAEQQLEIFNFRHFQKLRAICNADQQKKFDAIIQDVLRRMAPGRRPQGPPPATNENLPASEKQEQGTPPPAAKQNKMPPPGREGFNDRMPPPPGEGDWPPPPPGTKGKMPPPPREGNGLEGRRPPPERDSN